MARRAKLLNQFAHLQLLQRCAASCHRGRASVRIIADALRKSEASTPPTAAAVSAAVHPASTILHSPTTHTLSLALSPTLRQTATDPTTSNPHPKTPARPH